MRYARLRRSKHAGSELLYGLMSLEHTVKCNTETYAQAGCHELARFKKIMTTLTEAMSPELFRVAFHTKRFQPQGLTTCKEKAAFGTEHFYFMFRTPNVFH